MSTEPHWPIPKNKKDRVNKQNLNYKNLIPFLVICLLVMSFGGLFLPGPWYESLQKAPWTPPNLAFPIVWNVLYLCIAISGWQIFAQGNTTLKLLWVTQLFINAVWSWIFFGQHWVLFGLIDLMILDISIIALIFHCIKQQLKLSTLLMSAYLVWLCIATSLNIYILLKN